MVYRYNCVTVCVLLFCNPMYNICHFVSLNGGRSTSKHCSHACTCNGLVVTGIEGAPHICGALISSRPNNHITVLLLTLKVIVWTGLASG